MLHVIKKFLDKRFGLVSKSGDKPTTKQTKVVILREIAETPFVINEENEWAIIEICKPGH